MCRAWDVETDPEMASYQNSENAELFELAHDNRCCVFTCEIWSQLEEMKQRMLATLVRKGSPALIPNVRFRVAGKYTKLGEEEAQRAHNKMKY